MSAQQKESSTFFSLQRLRERVTQRLGNKDALEIGSVTLAAAALVGIGKAEASFTHATILDRFGQGFDDATIIGASLAETGLFLELSAEHWRRGNRVRGIVYGQLAAASATAASVELQYKTTGKVGLVVTGTGLLLGEGLAFQAMRDGRRGRQSMVPITSS